MSYYSDWKCGAISDSEYKEYSDREARMDEYYEEMRDCECFGCPHFKNKRINYFTIKRVCELGGECNQDEEADEQEDEEDV